MTLRKLFGWVFCPEFWIVVGIVGLLATIVLSAKEQAPVTQAPVTIKVNGYEYERDPPEEIERNGIKYRLKHK